jgi:hypothetical protein
MSRIALEPNSSGSGVFTISSPNSNTSRTLTLPDAAGTVSVADSNGIISANGIAFPATQSASANANTLDDYEEGTWTPVVPASSVTYTTRTGSYTKIGRLVFIVCDVTISAITSPTGGAGAGFITGLPFTAAAAATGSTPNLTTMWNGANFGGTVPVAQVNPNNTQISAAGCTNNAAFVDSSPANIWDAGGNWVKVSGFYLTT